MTLSAGQLNRRIRIDRPTSKKDAFGQPLDEWRSLGMFWANVRFLSGAEAIKADASVSVAKASIRIRYTKSIHAGMRVVLDETIFNIQAVLPDEQERVHVDLVCETGANNG